ncbi:MAG: hypothetical protein LBP32_03375 [Spirochaetaceae bacterium]|jgi:hypothetical protein|nr:hypothetical protein [Spirochaetaceae bacterium]
MVLYEAMNTERLAADNARLPDGWGLSDEPALTPLVCGTDNTEYGGLPFPPFVFDDDDDDDIEDEDDFDDMEDDFDDDFDDDDFDDDDDDYDDEDDDYDYEEDVDYDDFDE